MRTLASLLFPLLLFSIIAHASPALGAGNITLGATEIHPFVSLKETLSDNIFYTSTDERSDVITTVTPGVRVIIPFRMHTAEFGYYGVLNRYKRYDTEDTTDGFGNAKVDLKIASLFGLKLTDDYAQSHEGRGSSGTGLIEKYMTNTAAVSASYQLADRSKVQLDYGQTVWRFKTSNFRNRNEDLVSAYLYYRFLPKTSAFVEYDYKRVVFSRSFLDPNLNSDVKLNSNVNRELLGLTWEISGSSKGTIKAGAVQKYFTSPTLSDYAGFEASVDIRHDFTEDTSVTVVGQRTVNETKLQDTRYYIETGAYAELSHKFIHRLSGAAHVSYMVDDYSNRLPGDTTTRSDRITTAGIGVKYTARDWLELALGYDREVRQSNISVNDYTDNLSSLTATIAL